MPVNPVPHDYHTITPLLVVEDASRLIDFLKTAYGATELMRLDEPGGKIMHAQVKIGDSVLMLGDAMKGVPAMPVSLYLYVPDADATYQAAMNAGAESIVKPANQFWGDRVAAVKDPTGNRWWIATHIEDVDVEELAARARTRS